MAEDCLERLPPACGFLGLRDDIAFEMLLLADKTPEAASDWVGRWRIFISPRNFFFWVLRMLRNFFFCCFLIREGALLGVLPQVRVTLSASAILCYIAVSHSYFGDSRFFNDGCGIWCSHYCTARSQRFQQTTEIPLRSFCHFACQIQF